MHRELFAPNIQRIERIRTIRSVLQKVFLCFRILLGGLVLSGPVSPALHASGLNGKNICIFAMPIVEFSDFVLNNFAI